MLNNLKLKLIENKTGNGNPTLFSTDKQFLGIKFPILASLIKGLSQNEIEELIKEYDDSSFELSIIQGMLIGKLKDFDKALHYLKAFIPYVDNWATSDKLSQAFKIARKNECNDEILLMLTSSNPWEVRVGLIIILSHLINKIHFNTIFKYIDKIKAQGYYVDMGIAWLLAEMASHDSEAVLAYLKNAKINTFTKNKTLSKMRESYKISDEIKKRTYEYKK